MPRLLLLALLVGCAPRALPPSSIPIAASWQVDHEAMPALTLRALLVAETGATEAQVLQGGGSAKWVLPVFSYVIEHPTEGLVLLDAGFPRRTAEDVGSYPGRQIANLLGLRMEPGHAVADRLPEIGHDAAAVSHVVVTHMHPDHVGGLEDFPQARLWVGAGEWKSAFGTGGLGRIDSSPYADHADVQHVDFAGTPLLGPFDGSVDLFGDGTIVLVPLPGHTPGHLGAFVNLAGGSFLFTGDCAWVERHWSGPEPKSSLVRGLLEHDWRANWTSQWRIHAFAKDHPELMVVAGHEPSMVERLKPWPEPYR